MHTKTQFWEWNIY